MKSSKDKRNRTLTDIHADAVYMTALIADPDGETRFVDETIPYADNSGPLQVTTTASAVSVSFRWVSGAFDFNFHPAPRRRLVVVMEGRLEVTAGNGEARTFGLGDLLEVRDTTGRGHRSRSVDNAPLRSAFIALDDVLVHDRLTPLTAPPADAGLSIDYTHNREDAAGRSFTTPAHFPFLYGGPSGVVTPEIPLSGLRYSRAGAGLDYAWHPAPRRQLVLVLSGGIAMEYGSGQQKTVSAGEFLVGEDTDGRGHISRAEDSKARFSIFAHLA
jgi:quercetin dioxygenase-like cupin family protein